MSGSARRAGRRGTAAAKAAAPDRPDETRDRLLEAAGQVFAEAGFERATVRDIAARARANVASLHYHFGDKGGLYRATLKHAHRSSADDPTGGVAADADPALRFHGFVAAFMRRILGPERPEWHHRLMAREMMEPTGLLDELVRDALKPQLETLVAIVRSIMAPGAPEELVRLSSLSVIAQCVFWRHCGAIVEAFVRQQDLARPSIEQMTEHICGFSLCALTAWRSAPALPRARAKAAKAAKPARRRAARGGRS